MTDDQIKNILSEMAAEVRNGCGLVYETYAIKFSGMVDAFFVNSDQRERVAAIHIAQDEFGYLTPAEIKKVKDEMDADGCCRHGLDAQTCPCGCFE